MNDKNKTSKKPEMVIVPMGVYETIINQLNSAVLPTTMEKANLIHEIQSKSNPYEPPKEPPKK